MRPVYKLERAGRFLYLVPNSLLYQKFGNSLKPRPRPIGTRSEHVAQRFADLA
jgi:hypothetical protein